MTCTYNVSDLPERIANKIQVDQQSNCWRWASVKNSRGYGRVWLNGKVQLTHRAVYSMLIGEIQSGLTLDHICRVVDCCNPAHLEPVSHRENVRRGIGPTAINAAKTHCLRGHALEGDNLDSCHLKRGQRNCRTCKNSIRRERAAIERAARLPQQPEVTQ